jgi:hypothetical protein
VRRELPPDIPTIKLEDLEKQNWKEKTMTSTKPKPRVITVESDHAHGYANNITGNGTYAEVGVDQTGGYLKLIRPCLKPGLSGDDLRVVIRLDKKLCSAITDALNDLETELDEIENEEDIE